MSSVVLGATLLGEHFEPRQLFGMAFIAAGPVAMDGRLFRRLRQTLEQRGEA